MKPKQKIKEVHGILTIVTGDTELLLIKNLHGGHSAFTMFPVSVTILVRRLGDYCPLHDTNFHCASVNSSLFSFFVSNEPKWPHEFINHGRSNPPRTLSLPFPRSITCTGLVFRAHYFLLSSHTLSKAMLSLLKLESHGPSEKEVIPRSPR